MTTIWNLMRLIAWFFRTPELNYVRKDKVAHLLSALRQLRFAVGLLLLALLVGTLGYRIIERAPWFDAYYMSLVTLSTVGFGEVINLSPEGRFFTSFLILFNIGFFTYAVSTVIGIFADGKVHALFFDYNMNKRIQELRNHTIVCGFGRHASEVCHELSKQQAPFVVIEIDQEKIEILQSDTQYSFIQGDATADVVLLQAGIAHAKALVVTLPQDANNLFIVLSARTLNPTLNIVCRLNNAADEDKLLRAGANHVVAPERIGGFYMATLVNKPNLVEFFTLISNLGTSEVAFEELQVAQLKKQYRGVSIAQSGIQAATAMPIVGIRHADGQYQLNPAPDMILQPKMHIVVLGDPAQIKYFSSIVLDQSFSENE